MRAQIFQIVVIILLVTLQLSWANWLALATPQLLLAVIIGLALIGLLDQLWLWVGFGGLLLDLSPGIYHGLYLVLFGLVAIIVSLLVRHLFDRPSVGVAFVISLLASLLFVIIENGLYGQLSWQLVFPALSTSLIALAVYRILTISGIRREGVHFG